MTSNICLCMFSAETYSTANYGLLYYPPRSSFLFDKDTYGQAS